MEILPSLLGFIDAKVRTFKKITDATEMTWHAANAFTNLPKKIPVETPQETPEDKYIPAMDPFRIPDVESVSDLIVRKLAETWEGAKDPNKVVSFLAREAINPLSYLGGAGTFISRGAKSWLQPRYIEAVKLKVKGVSNDEIWAKTGTWLDTPDMIPRQEISDIGMAIRNPRGWEPSTILPGAEYQQGQLYNLITHPELTKAYPELLKNAFSKISKKAGDDKHGIFNETRPAVYAHAHDDDDVLKVLAHELQHYVQSKERFARGGNPSAVIKGDIPEADAFFQAWRDKLIKAGHDPAKATDRAAYAAYHNLAGEAEARATASRIYLNDEERRALPPRKTLMGDISIPYDKLIVRFGGGKSAK